MGYYERYEMKGVKKYNSVGGINPQWVILDTKRREEAQELKLRQQIAEERKQSELDLFSKKLEAKFDFLKRHSSNQNDIALALKVLQSLSL